MIPETAIATAEVFSKRDRLPSTPTETGVKESVTLALRGTEADWLDDKLQRLQQLKLLGPNWDSYGAERVDPASLVVASQLMRQLARVQGIEAPTVTASPDGLVCLSWDNGTRSVDAEIVANGEIAYTYLNEIAPLHDRDGRTRNAFDIAQLLTAW